MPSIALLATPSDVISGIETVKDAAVGNFEITTIASILGIALGAAATLFLFWWGGRKIVRMVKGAFTKGKLSI